MGNEEQGIQYIIQAKNQYNLSSIMNHAIFMIQGKGMP